MVDLNLQSKDNIESLRLQGLKVEPYTKTQCDVSPLHFSLYVYVKLINRRVFHGILKDLVVMFTENVYLEM